MNRRALSFFADLTDFAGVITDDGIDEETADEIRANGVDLIIV
jgi:DeoR/GlpR family transcriptional regulator of sugar metabolism